MEGRTGPRLGWRGRHGRSRYWDCPPEGGQPGQWPVGHRPGHSRLPRWARGPKDSGPWRRTSDDRLAGGVASGLAAKLGLDVTVVRVVFVLATLAGLFGAAAYVMVWLLVPAAGEQGNIARKALSDVRGVALAAGLASLVIVVMVIASALGANWLSTLAWPMVITVAGLSLIWRNAPPQEQATLRELAEPLLGLSGEVRWSRTILRVLIGCLPLAVGLGILLSGHRAQALLLPLTGIALVIAGIVVALGPWWLRIARNLALERRARVRAEERADMAARVHDSVLQTLALIQRRAGNSAEVVQLARAQERELRSWLFGGQTPGSIGGQATTLAAGVRVIQQDAEAQHGITVEAVTVGDCDLDDDLSALLAAAREATVNAAKWSGSPVVSLFAEVEPAQVSLFVRDRGRGFDPAAVPADRKGLSESIHARMARRGGTASVRSAPGKGTEVSLTMPRVAASRV